MLFPDVTVAICFCSAARPARQGFFAALAVPSIVWALIEAARAAGQRWQEMVCFVTSGMQPIDLRRHVHPGSPKGRTEGVVWQ